MDNETLPATHPDGGHADHDEKANRKAPSRWRLVAWFLLGAAGTAFLVGFLYIVVATWESSHSADTTTQAIRDTQKTNTVNGKNTAKILKIIKSCVTPGGDCARRAVKNQAGFAGALNQYFVLGLSCQARLSLNGLPPGISQEELTRMITRCVVVQLRNARKAITDQLQ